MRDFIASAPLFGVLIGLVFAPVPAESAAPGGDCTAVCSSSCLKPISIADRWDDVSTIPGYAVWAHNGVFDHEAFTDMNDNGHYDVGEVFVDANANGRFDLEAYHPTLTGYVPDPVPGNVLAPEGDLGRLLRLRPDPGDKNRADTYAAIVFPALGDGEPQRGARAYRDALAGCRSSDVGIGDRFDTQPGSLAGPSAEAFAVMVEGDPDARWDPATESVVGLREPGRSSRLVIVGLHDPRRDRGNGRGDLQFTKVVGFFIEEPGADGGLAGRLVKLTAAGPPCDCPCTPEVAFLRDCR